MSLKMKLSSEHNKFSFDRIKILQFKLDCVQLANFPFTEMTTHFPLVRE